MTTELDGFSTGHGQRASFLPGSSFTGVVLHSEASLLVTGAAAAGWGSGPLSPHPKGALTKGFAASLHAGGQPALHDPHRQYRGQLLPPSGHPSEKLCLPLLDAA